MKPFLGLLVLCAVVQHAAAQDFFTRGEVALAARDTTAAIAAFTAALGVNQKAEQANNYLGAIACARGNWNDAIPYLEATLKSREENVKAIKLLAEAYYRKKDLKNALLVYRKGEKLAPKDGKLLTGYGMALVAADSTDAAIRTMTLAKEYSADDPDIYRALAQAYLKQNVAVLGIMNYQKVIELDPKDVKTRFALAQVYEKTRQWTEAVAQYDGVIGIDSTHAEAYLAKGRILVLGKRYTRAIAPLKKFQEMKPQSVECSALLATAYFGSEDFTQAVKAAKRTLEKDSSDVNIWRIYAHSLVETKEYATALGAFAGLERRKAFEAQDQAKYGTALYGMGKEDDALKALLAAVQADTTNCDPYFNLGSLYMKKQDYVNAAAMFEKRIGCDPRSLSAYVNAAACYMQLKNYPRTRELLTKALELKPDFLQGLLWMARYYSQVDSVEKAKDQYDEVLRQIGANPEKYRREAGEAYYLTGSYFFQRGQYERAIDAFRKDLSVGYEIGSIHLSWGQAQLQLLDPKADPADNRKKIEEAVRHFRRAIDLEPNNAAAHLWLGQGLVLMRVEGDDAGNKRLQEEACSEYRKVLRMEPRNEDAKKSMERIGCK